MAYTYVKRYKIMEVSEDGLLKEPKERGYYYNENVFSDYYDTEQDAIDAIHTEDLGYDLVIITAMTNVWCDDGL